MNTFAELEVQSIDHPLPDVLSIALKVPEALRDAFSFLAGQHLCLQANVDGKLLKRNYSIHSSPSRWTTLNLSIRRIPEGQMSNHLFQTLKIGQKLSVRPPAGSFIAQTDAAARRSWYLFAAGTGITPIWSMVQAILQDEPKSFVRLLYGNKDQESILFKQELEELAKHFGPRLIVAHTLSAAKSGWLSSDRWEGLKGRISPEIIDAFLQRYPPPAQDCEYRVCGPASMNRDTKAHLLTLGAEPARVSYEQFGGQKATVSSSSEKAQWVDTDCELSLEGKATQIKIPRGLTLLEGIKAAGIKVPHSCEAGVCGSCQATLEQGDVHMPHHPALDASDLADQQILVCQARAKSSVTKLRF